jgi:hypothetical protein
MQTNNNQALVNAIAELTAQVEKLTNDNFRLREFINEVKPGHDGSAEIDAVIKALPRERVMQVLNLLEDYNLQDVETEVLKEYVSKEFGVEEIFTKNQISDYVRYNYDITDVYDADDDICRWVQQNRSMDEVFDEGEIVEWVRDNRSVADVFDHSDIMECVEDFEVSDVLTHFGEEIVMEECSNQGWSKSKDVSDVISQLEDVINQLKA